MSGVEIHDSGEAVWDDGEWISWSWIDAQQPPSADTPSVDEDISPQCDDDDGMPSAELLFRINAAKEHYEHTLDAISPDWGPIGEAYLAERFGIKLCRAHTEGHDARLGDELIEIKTITPHKRRPVVTVKSAGNFSILAVVKVAQDLRVEARFIRRRQLPHATGIKRIVVTWKMLLRLGSRTLLEERR